MTTESIICSTLSQKENWREYVEETYGKYIIVKEKDGLVLFIYGINADFTDPFIREARGIIIDPETWEVVCWPFTKFGEYDTYYADEIDWQTAQIQEKVDGSLVKLWFNKKTQNWTFSTNRCIDASDATLMDRSKNMLDVIKETRESKVIFSEDNTLDRDRTYMFELTSPDTQVVIGYNHPRLTYLGTRSNITGVEFYTPLHGVPIATRYCINEPTLDKCIEALSHFDDLKIDVASFNYEEVNDISIKHEGFVVVDSNFHRIKIKHPLYLFAARILDPKAYNSAKRRILEIFHTRGRSFKEWSGGLSVSDLSEGLPGGGSALKWYDYQYSEFKERSIKDMIIARDLWRLYDGDRKAFALAIKDLKYKVFMFKSISDLDTSVEDIFYSTEVRQLMNVIPTYETENLSEILKEAYEWNKQKQEVI